MMPSLSKKVGTRSCHRSCFYTMMILLIHLERLSLRHSMALNGRSFQTPATRRFHMSLDINRSWVPKARCMFVQPVEHTTNIEEVTFASPINDTFSYAFTSGGSASVPATITVTIEPANQLPALSILGRNLNPLLSPANQGDTVASFFGYGPRRRWL